MTDNLDSNKQLLQQELLINLVSYQKGSVVSRVLLKDTNGSITLFAFSAGEEISAHSTPYSAILYMVDGNAEVTIAGINNILKTGEIINLPKNVNHAIRAISDFKMLLTMVK
jgi:quercetin dioxygenase-like cupin family protein